MLACIGELSGLSNSSSPQHVCCVAHDRPLASPVHHLLMSRRLPVHSSCVPAPRARPAIDRSLAELDRVRDLTPGTSARPWPVVLNRVASDPEDRTLPSADEERVAKVLLVSAAALKLAKQARAAPVPQAPYGLVMCSLMRNEGRYVQEWIVCTLCSHARLVLTLASFQTYHYMLGADHFIL
jgi:hypothetical protein